MGRLVTDFIFQNLSWRNYFKGGLYDGVDNGILGMTKYELVDPIFSFRTGSYVMKKRDNWGLYYKGVFTGLYKLGDDQETPVGKWSDGEVIEYFVVHK